MDHLKQLDDVLEFLNKETPTFIIKSRIQREFKGKINDDHLDLVIDKLCRDGYANKGRNSEWAITYDGVIFLSYGGYKNKFKGDQISTALDTFQFWVLVLAAIFASLYYGNELLKGFLNWIYPYACY